MDLVGDMLERHLAAKHSEAFAIEQVVPIWRARFSRLPFLGNIRLAHNADRLVNRFADFPEWIRGNRNRFDLFHIVDHSYAQLVHVLPAERTIVHCHDLDAFRCLQQPEPEVRPRWFRAMARRTLTGLQQAAHVICVSNATKSQLLGQGWRQAQTVSVIYSGVHTDFLNHADWDDERAVQQLPGRRLRQALYLLHVGSTAPRKRIDILLRVFASVLREFPELCLVKVGGSLDDQQWALADDLGVRNRMIALPDVDRRMLAGLYKNAAVLLQTSDAEGFGLPVIEALACGCPVVASDLPSLREAGGEEAAYCPVGDITSWAAAVRSILSAPTLRTARQPHVRFSWSEAARQIAVLYRRVLTTDHSSRS
jgi:glycosyltransferase involved in cell wall biosynthesis